MLNNQNGEPNQNNFLNNNNNLQNNEENNENILLFSINFQDIQNQ